jgi:hypothetical protein
VWGVLILFTFLMFLLVPFGDTEREENDYQLPEEILLLEEEEDLTRK